jgi:hypothetical protein
MNFGLFVKKIGRYHGEMVGSKKLRPTLNKCRPKGELTSNLVTLVPLLPNQQKMVAYKHTGEEKERTETAGPIQLVLLL